MQTTRTVVEDLGLLLGNVSIAGPCVLGGALVLGGIRAGVRQVSEGGRGMVLVDSTHEDQYGRFASTAYVLPPTPPGENPERIDIMAALDEVRQARWRADIPLVVLTHSGVIVQQVFPGVTPEQATRIEGRWLTCSANWRAVRLKGA